MSTDPFFDGNSVAGELRSVFCNDITDAQGECASCGKVAVLAEGRVYGFAPGIIVRCSSCEHPLLRIVNAESRLWLDLRGLVYLRFRTQRR
jgi:Family of unknown function (DUF6510)